MKSRRNTPFITRTIATCLSALTFSSTFVARADVYYLHQFIKGYAEQNNIQEPAPEVPNAYEPNGTKKDWDLRAKEEIEYVASCTDWLLCNCTNKKPDAAVQSYLLGLLSTIVSTNDYHQAYALEIKLERVLENGKPPRDLLSRALNSIWEKVRGPELALFGSVVTAGAGLCVSMASLANFYQSILISGDALTHLKAASKSNRTLYPTLTWQTLKTKIPVIEQTLTASLAGQAEAIENIINQLNNHCAYLELCEQLSTTPRRSLVLHFYGAPGVGKSSALRIIADELGIGVMSFGMSSAVEDNGKRANTVLARLMNPDVIDTRVTKAYFKTALRKAVENPGTMIIGFDEIEKMRKLDAQISHCDYRNEEGYISPSSLDEAMRDVRDQGMFAGFNVADKIFVTISNETDESLKELEPSFRDRLMGSLIYFKKFDLEAYKELIVKTSRLLFDAYSKNNIALSWSDNALEHYAEMFYKEDYSGRRVVEFIDRVSGIVENYKDILIDSSSWIIDYDTNLDDIIVRANYLGC